MAKIIFLIISVGFLLLPLSANAATPSLFSAPYTDHALVAVPLSVKTEGVPLNALSISVRFNPDELSFVSAQENTLVGTRWVDTPIMNEQGVLTMSFIVPGGFVNSFDPLTQSEIPAEVATLFFNRTDVLRTPLTIAAQSAYYNTTTATPAEVRMFEKVITLNALPVRVISTSPTAGPQIRSITKVITEHRFFGSIYVVYVQAVDGAGIAQMKWWNNGVWDDITNPFSRRAHFFDTSYTLRIINGLGVYTETIVSIPGFISNAYRDYIVFFLALIVVVFVYSIAKKMTYKKQQ